MERRGPDFPQVSLPVRGGDPCVVALAVQATEIDREQPRDCHVMSRRSTGSGSIPTEEGTHKGCPCGGLDGRTFPSFPHVGATLVVALPVQATEIDPGTTRDTHAMSRRSTGSGSVSSEEGTRKGRPYGCLDSR